MAIKQIWMSPDTQKKSHYSLRTLGGLLGIVALALVLVCGGTVAALQMGWPVLWISMLLCLGVTALGVVLAVGLGQRGAQDATVFFLTEEDRLFALDARLLVRQGRHFLAQAAAMHKTQQLLRKLAQTSSLPASASEILKVEQIKENRTHFVCLCQVRPPNRPVNRHTYFFAKGLENQDLLLHQLAYRTRWDSAVELAENRKPFYILVSVLVCCGFAALCALSHPAVALLPQRVYFPCLGAAFVALCCVVWFSVRQHRGA
jgi:hypothetical protein